MLNIRPITPADASRWTELRAALWPDAAPEELAAEAADFFGGRSVFIHAVLMAEVPADGIVGFAELSRRSIAEGCTTSPVGFIEGWYVVPAYRGQGVGRALVRAAEAWARTQGCRELASDTELENLASVAAHRALGFEEVGVVRCFRKSLDPGAAG